jgi:hypothetical protein
MEIFEVYMYTPIHLSYSLDEVPCKFNFSGFDPLPPKNQEPQKIKKNSHGNSTVQVESEQWTVHSPHQPWKNKPPSSPPVR